MALDFLDGYVARRLEQQSAFGAALDVVVDVAQRGLRVALFWIHACIHTYIHTYIHCK